ncbi:MAG: beta-ketoacyl-ACP synthase II [Chitinispirillales bacterium]|jgi:3-oxoacyl-[acyl-carrier-protein] synthase II|nr:beta-ketoacyl-ACP synthase II [Chitinispirillales bacterium]
MNPPNGTNERGLERAVITGLGMVSPMGNDVSGSWAALLGGVSAAAPVTRFDCSQFKTRFACEVKGFDPVAYFDPKEAKGMDLYTQYAAAAAAQAFGDAWLEAGSGDPFRQAVIFASGIGGIATLQEELFKFATSSSGVPRFSPFMVPKMISNIAAGVIALKYGFRGPNYGTVSACASSSHALIDALNLIRLRKADVVIAGGSEAPINVTGLGGFGAMRALSTRNDDPVTASRPFDKDRDGFVLGEGAAALIVESQSHAKARGARIYAELAGGGMTADAFHSTLPHPEGIAVEKAMAFAMEDAGANPEDIGYINLHATSTPAGDGPEIMAVGRLFKNSLKSLHVSGTKSMTGHLLGGVGALEAAITVLSIHEGVIPPTINTVNIDPELNIGIDLTLGNAVNKKIDVAMTNNFGFGGQNASLVFRRV